MLRARDNPFQSDRIERVPYRFSDGSSWDALLKRLQELGNRGALVGPEGSGKTTLLEELHGKMAKSGYRARLMKAQPRLLADIRARPITKDDFLLLDSAERLTWVEWQRFKWASRSAGGLVITSHRAVWLPTLIECHTTPRLFEQVVRDLIDPNIVRFTPESLYERFDAHNGNIRSALRELYDRMVDRNSDSVSKTRMSVTESS